MGRTSDSTLAANLSGGTFAETDIKMLRDNGATFRTVDGHTIVTIGSKDVTSEVPSLLVQFKSAVPATATPADPATDGSGKTPKAPRKSRIEAWKERQLAELFGKSLDQSERAREVVMDTTELENKIIEWRDALEKRIAAARRENEKNTSEKRAELEKSAADMLAGFTSLAALWGISADDLAAIKSEVAEARSSDNKNTTPTGADEHSQN